MSRRAAITRSLDIVSAMGHPGMFEPWFRGASWDGWRTILRAAFGLPLSDIEREFFRSVAEREPPPARVRELWIVVGRRGGKDSVASLIGAHAAALFDQPERLRPGERALVMCLAVDRDQAKIVLSYTRSYFTDIPPLRAMVTRKTISGFELNNGVDVAVATNNFRSVRGRPVLCAIFDEVAFWKDEASAAPDLETYKAVTPGMATLPDAMLIGISSPYRKAGLLYDKWRAHFGKDDDRVLVVQAPSIALNPTLDQAIIKQAIEDDPAAATAEWLGQWRNDIGGYAPLDLIEAAVDRGVTVRPPSSGVSYVGFIDAASGTGKDSFTVGIAHAENNKIVLDVAHEIRPPFNPLGATEEAARLLKAYRIQSVTGDKYAAGYNVDAFSRCGITYQYAERDRSEIYIECLPLFTSGRVRLVDNRRLVTQFATLERRTSATGRDRVDHGHGDAHDDLCNCAAGALVAASSGAPINWGSVLPALAQLRQTRKLGGDHWSASVFQMGERQLAQMQRRRERRW